MYQLVGTAGKFASGTLSLSSTTARQYTLTFPTNFQSSDAIGFGNSVSSFFGLGTGDFIAGAPGYTGTLPTTVSTPPIPLVGAAAVVRCRFNPRTPCP